MARLPDEVIERIKTEVSLLRLVESQDYTIRKQGKDYALNCPFHKGDFWRECAAALAIRATDRNFSITWGKQQKVA